MISKLIPNIQKAEKLSGITLKVREEIKLPYKQFNQIWIKADRPVMELYATSLKASELQFYPIKNLKAWAKFGLDFLKGNTEKIVFKKLLGIRFNWRFTKSADLPFHADIIYYRQRAVVMVYTKKKRVLKIALTKQGKKDMDNEIISQRLASNILSEHIFIPTIIQELRNEDINFTVEEYFEGKRQSFKNKSVLEANYHKVFQFLLRFYLSAPIELQALSESKFLNHDFVEEFIRKQTHGAEVVSIFRKLYAKEKKMILCRIHGDLSHNNILSNSDQVCIIDWGKSKQHYLARDLDNSSYNTECVFDEFIERAHIDKRVIYSYKEQLFLGRFIEMNRLIHNGIVRRTITASLFSWTKSQILKLKEMGDKLS